jgi:hypothetical protein
LDSKKARGIADGFLKLAVDTNTRPVPDDLKKVAEDFPVIGVWEFKNMLAGSKAVFKAIVQHAGDKEFPWECCEYGKRCPILHPGRDGGPEVTGSKTAFDAQTPLCKSTRSDNPKIPPPPTSQLHQIDIKHARHMIQQVNIIRSLTSFIQVS